MEKRGGKAGMKKKLVFIMLFFFVFCLFVPQGTLAQAKYDPYAAIVVEEPFKNPDMFSKEELPEWALEYVRRFKLSKDASPQELMQKRLDYATFSLNNASYVHYGTLDNCIRFKVKVPGRDNYEFEIALTEYRYENGKIVQFHKGVPKEITSVELEKNKFFWAHIFCEAADYNSHGFIGPDFRERIIKIKEEILINAGRLEKGEGLEKIIAGKTETINGKVFTLEELMNIPSKDALSFASFAPKLAIITPSENVWGLCWLEIGVVVINPDSIAGWLLGVGDVTGHELFHRNIYLQGHLWAGEFDVETWAKLSERTAQGWMSYLYHPYLASLRRVGKNVTSFDAERAKEGIYLLSTSAIGTREVDKQWLEKCANEANKIYTVLRTSCRLFLPYFYQDPIYWSCVNKRLNDNNAAVKIGLYSKYALSLLGGPQRTKKWLKENENLLLEIYEEALKKNKANSSLDREKYEAIDNAALWEVVRILKLQGFDLRGVSEKEMIDEARKLIKMGIISCPQPKLDLDKWEELNNAIYKK